MPVFFSFTYKDSCSCAAADAVLCVDMLCDFRQSTYQSTCTVKTGVCMCMYDNLLLCTDKGFVFGVTFICMNVAVSFFFSGTNKLCQLFITVFIMFMCRNFLLSAYKLLVFSLHSAECVWAAASACVQIRFCCAV